MSSGFFIYSVYQKSICTLFFLSGIIQIEVNALEFDSIVFAVSISASFPCFAWWKHRTPGAHKFKWWLTLRLNINKLRFRRLFGKWWSSTRTDFRLFRYFKRKIMMLVWGVWITRLPLPKQCSALRKIMVQRRVYISSLWQGKLTQLSNLGIIIPSRISRTCTTIRSRYFGVTCLTVTEENCLKICKILLCHNFRLWVNNVFYQQAGAPLPFARLVNDFLNHKSLSEGSVDGVLSWPHVLLLFSVGLFQKQGAWK